jgi:GT2 family glycosyltransferase/SAM-dependent methyltransferase
MSAVELSIVIPTFDQASLLERCLSLLLAQSVPCERYEIVVVDDGSTDSTPRMLAALAARAPTVSVVRQPNSGPTVARNHGIRVARAPLVAFTDSDCEPAPDWVERLLAAFARHPDAAGVEGRTVTVPERMTPFTHQIENHDGGVYCTANIAYRRGALEAAGGFDEDYFYGHEDTDLALRVQRTGAIVFDPAVLVVHPPVPTTFWKLVRRPRVWTCQIVLAAKHPRIYRRGHGRGPFRVLLWHYGVRQLIERLWRFRGFLARAPGTYVAFVLAMLLQRVYLLAMMPSYLRRHVELMSGRKDAAAVESRRAAERRFHDDLYRRAAEETPAEFWVAANVDSFEEHALRALGPVSGRRILDCGCGDGRISILLARQGAIVYSLDVSYEALALAKKRAGIAGLSGRVIPVQGSLEDLPFADGALDGAFGSLVLHHVDTAAAGRELARVLGPRGRASFSENFGFNPLLNFARTHVIGRFGIPRLGTMDERPLDGTDLERLGERLRPELCWGELLFFRLFDRQVMRYTVPAVNRLCIALDRAVFDHFPSLRRMSYRGTLVLDPAEGQH